MFPQWYGNISAGMATRLSFFLVGIWWFGFAQITFRNVPELPTSHTNEKQLLSKGYSELKKVWSELKHTPRLKRFLLSFFLYNMATQTVMYVATLFGKSELKLSSEVLIAVILIIQFVAVPGAFIFSSLSKRFGNIIALRISIICWTILSVAAYFCDKKYIASRRVHNQGDGGLNEGHLYLR
jgi:UMF1 family MFS transporter